jgi:protein-S-isoprenylcysteine O-methyltransferase Ste14
MTETSDDTPEDASGGPQNDSPGVITIPPFIYLFFLAVGSALDFLFPVALLSNPVQYTVGLALIAASGVLLPFVLGRFRASGTNLDVRKPTTAIISDGPYRFSRNPAYLSLSLLYAGIGVAADSVWIFGLLLPTLVVMHYGVIAREERYLEAKFGEEYLRYKRSVRRWI